MLRLAPGKGWLGTDRQLNAGEGGGDDNVFGGLPGCIGQRAGILTVFARYQP